MVAPSSGYRRRWYGGNRHYYDDGHGYAPRRRGGGIASAIGCLAFAVVVLALVIVFAVL